MEDLFKILGDFDKKQEVLEFVTKSLETAKVEASRKANSEAENVRKRYKKNWENIGLDPEKEDFEGKIVELKEKMYTFEDLKTGKVKEKDSEIKTLSKQIEILNKKFEDSETEKRAIKKQSLIKSVESKLKDSLIKGKAKSPDILTKALMADLSLDDENQSVEDVKFGEVSIEDKVKSFLDENKDLVSSHVNSGSDTGNKSIIGSKNANTIESRREHLRGLSKSIV